MARLYIAVVTCYRGCPAVRTTAYSGRPFCLKTGRDVHWDQIDLECPLAEIEIPGGDQ